MGPGLLVNWTSKYIFCRCLGTALHILYKTTGASSESRSVIRQLSSSVLSVFYFLATGGGRSEVPVSSPRASSPWTDHSGGQL